MILRLRHVSLQGDSVATPPCLWNICEHATVKNLREVEDSKRLGEARSHGRRAFMFVVPGPVFVCTLTSLQPYFFALCIFVNCTRPVNSKIWDGHDEMGERAFANLEARNDGWNRGVGVERRASLVVSLPVLLPLLLHYSVSLPQNQNTKTNPPSPLSQS